MSDSKKALIQRLRKELPPAWDRAKTGEITGGIVSAGYLRNLCCAGKGPKGVVKIGRKAIIEREDFLEWLESRGEEDAKPSGALRGRKEGA